MHCFLHKIKLPRSKFTYKWYSLTRGKRAVKYYWIYLIKQIFVKHFLKWNVIFTYSSFWLFPLLNFRRQNVLYLNARLVSRHVVSRIGLVTCTHLVLVWVKQGFIPHSTSKFGGRMKNVQSDFTKQKAVGITCDNNIYAFCKLSHFLPELCKDFG